ncbi:MAG: hypothetical protein LBD17_02040 [Endomicrobium sp.]|jgi:hypothetical protein|nr:hypothetical protein [Endomicrobium sp.]
MASCVLSEVERYELKYFIAAFKFLILPFYIFMRITKYNVSDRHYVAFVAGGMGKVYF